MDQFYFEEGYLDAGYFSVVREAGANLSSSFSSSASGDIAPTTGYYIPDYIADDYYQGGVTQSASANLTASATVSVDATRIQPAASNLTVSAANTTTGVKQANTGSTLTVTVAQSSSAGTIKQGTITLNGVLSVNITVEAIRFVDSLMEVNTSFAATAAKTTSNASLLEFFAALNAQNDRTRGIDSILSASYEVNSTAARTRDTNSSLAVSFTLSADVTRTRDASANTSSTVTINADSAVNKLAVADLSSTVSANIDGKLLSERPLVSTQDPNFTAVERFGTYASRYNNSHGKWILHPNMLPDNETEWFIEGFAQLPGSAHPPLFTISKGSSTSLEDELLSFDNETWAIETGGVPDPQIYPKPRINFRNSSDNGFITDSDPTDWRLNTANYAHFILMWKPGLGFKFFGDRISSAPSELKASNTGDYDILAYDDFATLHLGYRPSDSTHYGVYIDELRIVKGVNAIANHGYDFASTSIAHPTVEFDDTAQTKLLLHFELDTVDDFTPGLAEAYISATASVSSLIGSIKQNASAISTNTALSVTAQTIIESSASLAVTASESSAIGTIKQFDVALIGAFAPTVTANAILRPDVFLESAFTSTVDATRNIGPITASITSTASITADVDRNIGEIAIGVHSGTFAIVVDAVKNTSTSSTVAVQGTLAVDFEKYRTGEATVGVVSALTATAEGYPGLVETLQSSATLDFGNNAIVVPEINWLPRRSVIHFDNPYSDVVSTDGVDGSITLIDISPEQTGYANSVGTDNESNGGIAYFNNAVRTMSVQRTTGRYNTNIDTNDFTFDAYVRPYGETSGFHRIVKFEDSANNFEFGYTYDLSVGELAEERFNFIVRHNGSDVYTYNLTVSTGTPNYGVYQNDYYNWIYFRIQRINGNLAVKWQRLGIDSSVSTIISDTGYNTDFGSGYRLFGSGVAPTRIDLVALQIATPDFSFFGDKPSIPRFYKEYDSAGAILDTVTTSLSVDPIYVLFGDSDVSSQFTLPTVDYIRYRDPLQTNIPFASSIVEVEPVIRADAAANLSTPAFSITIDAVKTTDVDSALIVAAEIVTDNVRAKLFDIALDTQFTLPNVAYDFFRGLAISAEVNATVDAQPLRIKQLEATLTGAFAPTVDANAIIRPEVYLETFTNATVDAVIFAGAQANVSSAFSVAVAAERTVDYTANLSAAFSVDANIFRIQPARANLTVSATLPTVDYVRYRDNDIALNTAVSAQINPYRVRYFAITLNTSVSAIIDAQLLIEAGADIAAQFTDTFVVTRLRKAEADLTAFGFVVSVGDVINIDSYRQLIVPTETRLVRVKQENNTVTVPNETRILVL